MKEIPLYRTVSQDPKTNVFLCLEYRTFVHNTGQQVYNTTGSFKFTAVGPFKNKDSCSCEELILLPAHSAIMDEAPDFKTTLKYINLASFKTVR